MTEPAQPDGVTLTEGAQIASRVLRRPVSPAQLRSILILDTTGRTMEPRQHGDTRTFSVSDVAEAILVLRLRRDGVSPTVARVVTANLRGLLAKHWAHGDAVAIVVMGLRGFIVPLTTPPVPGEVARIALPDVWKGLGDRIRALRADRPLVRWNQPVAAAGEASQ